MAFRCHRPAFFIMSLPITVPTTTFNLQSSTYIPHECSVSLFTRLYPPTHEEPLNDKEETDFSSITHVLHRLDTASQELARLPGIDRRRQSKSKWIGDMEEDGCQNWAEELRIPTEISKLFQLEATLSISQNLEDCSVGAMI
ncbi:uncharacterized protein IAS62_004766 [Cryptococcus decagattii]|uniref:Uncharacterized protein n=1 Tax=Cryptococcus decagattii TaxID=1859122 RepID=A0ABZ2AY11_9TREE